MTVDKLTKDQKAGMLKQLADNMWNVKDFCTEELNTFTATATHAVISFPYKIKVLGTRIECVNAATTGVVINLTDGTNTITTTLPTSSTSYVRAVADQDYAKDTRLHIQSDAVGGITALGARFMFHYVIDERKNL